MSQSGKSSKLLNRTLMHTAAKLYYVQGISQLRVAERMQVSTATVSRLLAGAREEGIVRFEVIDLEESDTLGGALAETLGLKEVRVLESDRPAALATQVGSLLTHAGLDANSVLAIGWGRMVQSVINGGLPALPHVTVVPTTGGMHETAAHFQINEFVRNAAEQINGEPCFFHAPSVASPELRAELLRDAATARVLQLWSQVDAALLGIGEFQRGSHLSEIKLSSRILDGIAGDVARRYFTDDGAIVSWPDQDHLMAITVEQLRRIPLSIGVATGRNKARAIVGASQSKMINALVTDAKTALAVQHYLQQTDSLG